MRCQLDITIEPVIFLLAFSNGFSTNGQVNVIMSQVCSRHNDNGSYANDTNKCLAASADLNTIKSMLQEVLPILPVLVGGIWRDLYGRNIPPMVVMICGQIVGSLTFLLQTILTQSMSILVTITLSAVFTGLTGSLALLMLCSICYVTARTSVEDRTYRMSFIFAAYLGGLTFGLVMGGVVLQCLGAMSVFIIATVIALISLLYLLMFVSEESQPLKTKHTSLCSSFLLLVKKREEANARLIILLMILVNAIYGSILMSEGNVFMFFLQNSLKFSIADSGFYSSYKSIMLAISTFVTAPLLSKVLKMNDIPIGILSSIVLCLGGVWAAFSTSRLQLALNPIADLFKGGIFAIDKSIMTKCIGPEELGKVFGAEFVIEACFHLFFLPFYTYVYNSTNAKMPGAFFLISAMFGVVLLLCFCVTKCLALGSDKKLVLDGGSVKQDESNSTKL